MVVQKKIRYSVNRALFDDYVIRAAEKLDGDTEEEFARLFDVVEKIKKNVLIPPQ
jgi:hypothetical protein